MLRQSMWQAFECYLRIDRLDSGWAILRVRATYTGALVFGTLQALNIPVSRYTLGEWSELQLISGSLVAVCAVSIVTLRWVKNPHVYAMLLCLTMLFGTSIAAMPDHTGIDTSLLPFIVISPLLLTFIAGWRAGPIYFPASFLLLIGLAENSVPGVSGLLQGMTTNQELRLTQGIFALTLATFAASALSAATQEAMDRLESTTARAQNAEAAKSEFLASMSHELRTPMNAVLGLTGVLLSEGSATLSERHLHLLGTIDRAGTQLLAIVDDILNLSKLEANKVVIEAEAFDLHALLQNAIETFSGNALRKSLKLELTTDAALPRHVLGDDLRLRQILSNLISNALKFTEEGGVFVRSGPLPGRDGWVWIEVQDTGCGVPEARSEAIFDPFEQAEKGSIRRFGGTGLGLPICRKLAELMGGEVILKSTGAAGSTFVVILPLPRTDAKTVIAAVPALPPLERFAGLRVLVVEDNEINRLVANEILKMLGACPLFATNGVEALETLADADVDVVLMDKHMPEMDGIEATRAIRASGKPWAGIPIIAATADAMEGEEAALLAVGMDAFVSKPVKAEQLASIIQQVLSVRRDQPDERSVGRT